MFEIQITKHKNRSLIQTHRWVLKKYDAYICI